MPTPEVPVAAPDGGVEMPDGPETSFEQESAKGAEKKAEAEAAIQSSQGQPSATAPLPQKDEATMQIEGILEEGLGQMYAGLSDDAKKTFRDKGEEVAKEIGEMMKSAKIKTSRVLRLIRDWLLTIPKINKFFMEQEAKIKTDRILELHRKQHDQNNVT